MSNAATQLVDPEAQPRTAECWAGLWDTVSECDKVVTEIEGKIPEGLVGTLFRNGPANRDFTESFFDGDGMMRALTFNADGSVRFQSRYVQTEKYVEQSAAGKPTRRLAGTNLPGGVLRNIFRAPAHEANTSAAFFGDRLWALEEGGHPYEIDVDSLETGDLVDFGGALHARTAFTAHPHMDPDSGDCFAFGIHFGGRGPSLKVYRIDRQARHHAIGDIALPRASFVHDYGLSKKWMAFFLPPMVTSLPRVLLGLDSFFGAIDYRPELGMQIALMSRDGGEPIWIDTEAAMAGHVVSAWDEGDELIVDTCQLEEWSQMGDAAASFRTSDWAGYGKSRIHRYRINPAKRSVTSEKICEMPAEFPSINRLREGKGATKAYFSANTQPDEGGWYRALMKLDLASGQHEICDFGRDSAVHEAVFVPKHPDGSGAEDDGWLINLVHRGPERETEANVLDARCIADGPVATIKLRENTGVTFHGVWVPA